MSPSLRPGTSEGTDALLADLIEEITDKLRAGVAVDVDAYVARHPERAAQIRELLPALQLLAAARSAPADGGSATGEPSLLPGVLGDFRILREVGRGGMGVVYEAEQVSLRRRVALKVLPFAGMLDSRALQRFHNEARAAACLHHTNIVPVYFVGSERGVHFYAMQFIDGQSLAALLEQERGGGLASSDQPTTAYAAPPSPAGPAAETAVQVAAATARAPRDAASFRRVAKWGIQAAEALDYAHQMGVVHRDIKPANLMLDGRGDIWVTDFGLAQLQQGEASLTMTGELVGTVRYMSPEQALAQRVGIDHRTDVYSLGVTLYELLTLEPALDGKDREELRRRIAFEEPRPPRRLNKAIPEELETIVLKAMEKNPGERYATAQELADDLERWLKDEPIRARRPTVVQRLRRWARRHRPVVAGLVAGLLTLLVLGVVLAFAYQRRLAETERTVTAALAQAETLLAEGDKQIDHPERWLATARLALAALEKAEELLATGAATEELTDRVRQVRVAVEAALTDSHLLRELDHFRLGQAAVKEGYFVTARAAPLYAKALEDYGVDVAAPEAAAARVRDSRLREALLTALADWSRVTQDKEERRRVEKVYQLALPADSLRPRLLAAVRGRDGAGLEKLTKEPAFQDLPPATVVILANDLAAVKKWGAAERLLRAGLERKPGDFWLNHELGMVLIAQGRSRAEEAVGYLRVALALRSDSPSVHRNLGIALSAKGDLEGAIRRYQAALQIDPNYANAHYSLGILLSNMGRLDEAIAEYREAIRLRKDFAEAHYNLGLALSKQNKLDEAITANKEAIRSNPDYAEAHNNLGFLLSKKGQLDEAIAEYRKAIHLKKDLPEAHYGLGNALREQKKLAEAIASFRKAIELDPKDAGAHYNLGLALTEQKKLDEAVDAYTKAIGIKPDYAEAYNNLGVALTEQKKLEEAVAACTKAIALKKDYASAYNNLGLALTEQKKLDKAIADFSRAIELDPKFALAWRNRGIAYTNLGQPSKAVADFSRAIELDRKGADFWENRGDVYGKLGQYDKAVADYETVLKLAPAHAGAHNSLAWLLATCPDAKLRDPDRAVQLAKKAVQLAPLAGDSWNTLGVAHYRAGDWKAAVAALNKSMELRQGGDAFDTLFLAMAHRKLGSHEESRKAYAQALQWLQKNEATLARNKLQAEELRRFRREAEEVLELKK